MADEPKTDDNALRVFDLEDATIENIYANTTHAIVGEGDITLYLGFQQIESSDRPAFDPRRIILTHSSFMRMMEYWATRYHFLTTLYGGQPVTLREVDRDAVAAAFDTMLGRTNKEADQDGAGSASAGDTESFDSRNES